MFKEAFSSFAHLFFPHVCAGCGSDVIQNDSIVCMHCSSQMPFTNFHIQPGNPVEKKFWGRLHLQAAASTFYFTKNSFLQNLLHAFKYKSNKDVGYYLGTQMAQQIKGCERFSNIHVLIPLPLFASREKKRGYNQATILCNAMSNELQIPVVNNAVIRGAATNTQTHKTRAERWDNMDGKFILINEEAIQNKHILLVDDVVTTGATLEACGKELLKAPGSQLSILTLAYAIIE